MSNFNINHLKLLYRTFAEKSIPRMTKEEKLEILSRQVRKEQSA